jgi:exo-1,4-beta-D-glucosaminidase
MDEDGSQLSQSDFIDEEWFEAQVPGTVLGSLVNNGLYPDPYFGTNLRNIPIEQFQDAWWYRTEFELAEAQAGQTILLNFNGINYYANIWLNGRLLAKTAGAFRRFCFNVTDFIKTGHNALAVEIFPPKAGDYSIGFVDWNPEPPDRNMGLFREVYLSVNGGVAIENPTVSTALECEEPLRANLRPEAELVNYTEHLIEGRLIGQIDDRIFSKQITLHAGERKTIHFQASDFPELVMESPQLWWPNNLGDPHLYQMKLDFEAEGQEMDTRHISFGVRTIEDYWTPAGHRGFKINGKPILIKGAGWVDDLLLQDTHESLEAQIAYVKHLNLNCIRLEGFWGKDQHLYDLCDRYGILIMVGWSCHWEHEQYLGKPVHELYGGVVTEADQEFIAQCWKDQMLWLRHHPSIFLWTVASDFIPHPDLERRYIALFDQYDRTRPYVNSTGGVGSEQAIVTSSAIISEVSGNSGMKMLGPYAYTPPIYWYINKDRGGAYGFNTETCPGANVPPLESILRTIPEEHLWPVDEVWSFHCGRNAFATLDRIETAISKRYGAIKGVADFTKKAQWLNYELMRPMFEAFRVNQGISTGVIQWMLNSAFPEMYWQLYDSFLRPNGAFYATRKACRPKHLMYHYGEQAVYLINESKQCLKDHLALIRIFDAHSRERYSRTVSISAAAASITTVLQLPEVAGITTTWFLDLRLYDAGQVEVGNNFYWLSTRRDELDEEAEVEGWDFYTPSKTYADLTMLENMPRPELLVQHALRQEENRTLIEVSVANPSENIAFFTEFRVIDGSTGQSILPVFWEDNYISLLPGEQRLIRGHFAAQHGKVTLVVE